MARVDRQSTSARHPSFPRYVSARCFLVIYGGPAAFGGGVVSTRGYLGFILPLSIMPLGVALPILSGIATDDGRGYFR